jgi:uncharacterized membrane protein YidH (DUF202 family)
VGEHPTQEPKPDLSLTSNQLSWMRTELSNVRTLLAWARTSVSMIGFGFTIYNFYRGFLDDLAGSGRQDAARNLGLALVAAGTLAMLVAIWNYWSINQALVAIEEVLQIPLRSGRGDRRDRSDHPALHAPGHLIPGTDMVTLHKPLARKLLRPESQ